MKWFKWAWAFVPEPAKVWVAIGGVLLILAAVGGIVWKIDQGGYNRCEGNYAKAAKDLKDSSREEILKVEGKYDSVKDEIYRNDGANSSVGPRVEHAIDSMPLPGR